MKKTYISPNTKAFTICCEGLIAQSLGGNLDGTGNGGTTTDGGITGGDTRQQNSLWDSWNN